MKCDTSAFAQAGNQTHFWSQAAAFAIVVVLTLSVTLLPAIDLITARQFYIGEGHFSGTSSWLVIAARKVFLNLYVAACIGAAAALIATWYCRSRVLRMGSAQWLLLVMFLSIGPGLVANLAFKDQWGRARPRDVIEFGGERNFSSALVPVVECRRNCSFVCGESSSIFALFFGAACLWRRSSAALIWTGLALGSVAGLIRIAQGAHFLSDVIFSGVFMAATVLAVKWTWDLVVAQPQKRSRPIRILPVFGAHGSR